MSGGHLFTITELRSLTDPAHADDGERFEWTSDTSTTGARGGARACPRAPWKIGLTQHTVRTDYPNARTPSEQVMGPRRKPFTLEGRWLDKWNYEGYAEEELERFEKLVERGNRCRFAYGNQVLEGVITDLEADYRGSWEIGYAFTVSVHNRPEGLDPSRTFEIPNSPEKSFDDLDLAVQAMLEHHRAAPRAALSTSLASDVDASLATLTASREALSQTIDNRARKASQSPIDAFQRVATQFRAARGAAYALTVALSAVRADTEMGWQTALGVLNFETWIRGLRFGARVAMGSGHAGAAAADEQARPNALRLYRPRAGESLYSIARKFYGTPHAWHLIYQRNALSSLRLAGTETLIIPERGGV
jgi:hypothetical protein